VIVSIPFFLYADIYSPRASVIRAVPVNLIAHAQSKPETVEASVSARTGGPAFCAAAAAGSTG